VKWWDSRFVLPNIPAVTSTISDLYVSPVILDEVNGMHSSTIILKKFFCADHQQQGLLMSGNIGVGKSVFLRQLTLQTEAMLKESGCGRTYVPLLVSLGSFDLIPGSMTQSLVQYYKKLGYSGPAGDLERFFKQCLERGHALLLFDGIDEQVDSQQRANTLALLHRFFTQSIKNTANRLIISGRRESFVENSKGHSDFVHISFDRWRSAQVFQACRRWAWADESQGDDFWRIVQSNDLLFHLARHPLIFHLLTTLFSIRGMVPFQEMSGLLDACCEMLESSWSFARRSLHSTMRDVVDFPEDYSWLVFRRFLCLNSPRREL